MQIFFFFFFCVADEFNIDTDDAESEGKCNIVISLMQDLHQVSRRTKPKSLQIGFAIYKVNKTDSLGSP